MILDAQTLPDGTELFGDICIVGSGPAGLSLAARLAHSGHSALLVEAGGIKRRGRDQELYRGEVADPGLRHASLHRYRERHLGGTSAIWGGRCIPFDPIDFAQRDYVPESGWPFAIETLDASYREALDYCEAGAWEYQAARALPSDPRSLIPGLSSDDFITDAVERFSRPTDFSRRFGGLLKTSRSIQVLLNANVVDILTDHDGRVVEGLDIRTFAPGRLTARAGLFVLAAGGLETTRLLLNGCIARRGGGGRRGLGNQGGALGRFYMSHLRGTIGTLTLDGAPDQVAHGYGTSPDGIYCRRILRLSEAAQRREGILNSLFRLHHPPIVDPTHRNGILSAVFLVKNTLLPEYRPLLRDQAVTPGLIARHIRNLIIDAPAVTAFGADWLRRRTLASRKLPSVALRARNNAYRLEFQSEQAPNRASCVTLSDATDAFGLRRLRVDWRTTDLDVATVIRAYELLGDAVARSGAGTLRFDRESIAAEILLEGPIGGHHLGTTRMAAQPADGVVDPDCRVFGTANLYVAGGSVFPTSGQANPTLTIVALAIRLADHLAGLARGTLSKSA